MLPNLFMYVFIMSALCTFLDLGNRPDRYCKQKFSFIFHDKSSNVFWIREQLIGDGCQYSNIIQVKIDDGGISTQIEHTNDFDTWYQQKTEQINTEQLDYVVDLEESNKGWEYALLQLKVKKPSYNAKLMNYYLEELNTVCGAGWNNAMGINGRDLPKISSDKLLKLIYFYPEGLYFNYELSQVICFPDTQYLLMFTHQETLCHGGESMHGFLLFKID